MRIVMVLAAAVTALLAVPACATMKRTNLELQDYGSMVLMTTVISGKGRVACFALPDGTVAIAREKDQIGLRQATIVRISEHNIEISEFVSVNRGEWADARMIWPVAEATAAGDLTRCRQLAQ